MSKRNIFKEVPVAPVKKNLFDLSHEVKMSGQFGWLYPVLCIEALPGDTIRDQMTALVRFAPMLAPIMHRVDVKTDFFFVPMRLTTHAWEPFITGGQDGEATEVLPYVTPFAMNALGAYGQDLMNKGQLWDYLGLPPANGDLSSGQRISVCPFRAYTKIYNDYFRDPNLDDEVDLNLEMEGDVTDVSAVMNGIMDLRRRGWDRGYFTSALPFAQRGPSVLMPLVGSVDFDYKAQAVAITEEPIAAAVLTNGVGIFTDGDNVPIGIDNIESATLAATSTINDLRRGLAIQRWLENNARGGARYNEQIFSHFRTRVPDYRLQISEYLGGGRQPVQISEVLATANDGDAEIPVGDMAGHGISVGKSNRFTYHCQEHGYVIGIMSIVPRPGYSQGLAKMWTRENKFDYAWPELAHLGEQEILSKELFYSFTAAHDAANNGVFGYIPRYAEYKYMEDRIAGDFRTTLAFWHLNRIFTSRPTLSAEFVRMIENPGNEESYRRIFAVQDGTDYLWIQLFHKLTAMRPLPYFGVPMLNG